MSPLDLESLVREVAEGRESREALVSGLMQSKVAILLDKGLENGQLAPDARFLVLNGPDGSPVIAAFTSVEKGSPWVKREPGFAFALNTAFSWVVQNTPGAAGIAINPGYKFDFRLSRDEVQSLKPNPASGG